MSSSKRTLAAVAAVLTGALTATLTGCGSDTGGSGDDPLKNDPAHAGTVVVGSNNFPESILLADLYGEALKAKGLTVEYKHDIGSRETTYGMIENGTLTVLPEYNGALLAHLAPKAAPKSEEETDELVAKKLSPGLGLLKPSPAQDRDAIGISPAAAKKYHLTDESTIGDLKGHAKDLVVGGSPEFQTRHQGLEGLKSVYGVTFKSFKALDAGGPLTLAALKNNTIQAADIFTTDPNIAKNHFVVLQDPENLFGFENIIPLVHKADLPKKGVDALNAVSAELDSETLLDLNAQVQNDKKDALDVARAWLKSRHLA